MGYTVECSYISSDEFLLLSAKPINFLETEMGYRGLDMLAVGLNKTPDYRVAYVLPSEMASRFTDVPGVDLYEPLTSQVQSALKGKPYPATRN